MLTGNTLLCLMLTPHKVQGSLCVASGAQIPAICVLACYWSMVVCYWGISQSQTTTQLAGIWAPLHGDQQHSGTLVHCKTQTFKQVVST